MGLYASTNAEAKAFRGLHLYHFALSNCSQRVRIALEEKSLRWLLGWYERILGRPAFRRAVLEWRPTAGA